MGSRISPLAILASAACTLAAIGLTTSQAATSKGSGSDLKLKYPKPATQWNEALPVGNGRLGAMVFGGTTDARYQLNEDSLWCGKPHDYAVDGAAQFLPRIRQLLLEARCPISRSAT